MDEQAPDAKRHDPFDDERWSFSLAAAWIIWRSREHVAQLLSDIAESEGRVQVFDIFNEAARRENGRGGPPKGGVLPFVEAQADLWEQLKQGRLVAMGVKVGEATWSQIAPDEWCELDYYYCRGKSNALGLLGIVKYSDVTLPRADVLTLWPLIQPANSQSRRGRKPKIDVDYIRSAIWEFLDDNGDISGLDPEWRTQSDIQVEIRKILIKEFGEDNIPGTSSLKGYVSRFYPEWKSSKVKN
jgi:hypothetical protein